ncbi:SRPBCC domain-containing protein [Amycolatopsis aidingensis]|uniref:SRPBCC domain-containing protein n=1 Tax=Amycolatopsis aidingensis TaxID=2842453 RepID=UPI001C0A97D2|nr:SRPBCC domain-containing protein [Amycolatopsis aidingensis]
MGTPDRIEREIVIDAPVERVWSLVTEPGWWISDAGDRTGRRQWREGDLEVVQDPRYGRFPVRLEQTEPRRYLAYRWASAFPGEDPGTGNSTLIEFWLTERDGGTVLRVAESGFAALATTDEARERAFGDNTGGWAEQLDVLKRLAEE